MDPLKALWALTGHHLGLREKPALPPPQSHSDNTVSGGQPHTLFPIHPPPFLFHRSISQVTDVLWFEVSQHQLLLSLKKKLPRERSLILYYLKIESAVQMLSPV